MSGMPVHLVAIDFWFLRFITLISLINTSNKHIRIQAQLQNTHIYINCILNIVFYVFLVSRFSFVNCVDVFGIRLLWISTSSPRKRWFSWNFVRFILAPFLRLEWNFARYNLQVSQSEIKWKREKSVGSDQDKGLHKFKAIFCIIFRMNFEISINNVMIYVSGHHNEHSDPLITNHRRNVLSHGARLFLCRFR